MKDENRLFEALLDVIPFAAYAVDVETYEVVYANKQMVESMYAPRESFCWKKLYGQESACSWCTIPQLKQRKRLYSNDKLLTNFFDEGSDKWFQSYDELVRWPDGRTVKYAITVDITEQKEIQAAMIATNTKLAIQSKKLKVANLMLEQLAKKDYLTQINNRGEFFKQATQLFHEKLEKNKELYALMLDIDNFKSLNDSYGHALGDEALKQFVKAVQECLDEKDIFGRLGGEEFAIITIASKLDEVVQKCEKIKEKTQNIELMHEGDAVTFSVSIGVSAKQEQNSIDALLDLSDKELYNAKKAGKNRVKVRALDARK